MRSSVPKVLHPIANRPMLHHVLDLAQRWGRGPTVVVVGPNAEVVRKSADAMGGEVAVAVQQQPLGTADAVRAAEPLVSEFDGDLVILYADTPLITEKSLDAMTEARAKGAAIVVLGFTADDPAGYGRLITNADGELEAIVEERDANDEQRACRLCNSGVILADRRLVYDLIARVSNNNAKNEFYLTDIVALARAQEISCAAVICDQSEVLGVNSRADLAKAEAAFQTRRRQTAMESGVTLTDPATVYFSFDTEVARDVTIGPNVYFGPGVRIDEGAEINAFSHLEGVHVGRNADIGPFARVRPGSEIGEGSKVGNFVEVKKSSLAPGVKVGHLTYIGDASVGENTNIGAGTIVCNYDGFEKHSTEIGRDVFIGSNNSLVAPVKIGDRAYTATGSVINKDVGKGALAVARSRQEEKPGWADRFSEKKKRAKE